MYIKEDKDGFRFYVDKEYTIQAGEIIQFLVKTIEWQSALTVYHKYKNKHGLSQDDLIDLRTHVIEFSENRTSNGKKVGIDILTQEASAEMKRMIELKKKTIEENDYI